MRIAIVCLSLFLCLCIAPALAFGAEAPIKLFLNGKPLKPEVAPRIVKDNTVVPVRIIAEELGAKVSWDGKDRKVTVQKGAANLELWIDNPKAVVNGSSFTLEVAPAEMNGTTMLPVRFVGEQLGVAFTWDELTRSVLMFSQEDEATKEPEASPVFAENPDEEESTLPPEVKLPAVPAAPANQPTGSGTAPAGSGTTSEAPRVLSIEIDGNQLLVKTSPGAEKPRTLKLSNPDRLVLDFPGTTLDSSLAKLLNGKVGELPSRHPLVQKIRFSNFSNEPPTVRVILDMKQAADLRLVESKQPNQWAAEIRTPRFKVVIDAGHGGHDPGAVSVTGKHEKDFTLAMAKKVSKLLAEDPRIEPIMTRSDDTFVELNGRVAIANDNQADLFLAIHGNKLKDKPAVRGVETYYFREESAEFAKLVHKHVVEATGFPNRNVRKEDFRVIHYTTMPAVLVEMGYLSNKTDEAALYTESFQDQVAASLVSAIREYLNIP